MHKVKLLRVATEESSNIVGVESFEEETKKQKPYYQGGNKYALCPTCNSSVQIIGGSNNKGQSRSGKKMFASHTQSEIFGFNFNEISKKNCPNYHGNKNNWQGIYESNNNVPINKEVENYILNHKVELAEELTTLTDIKFEKYNREAQKREPNSLFEKLYESFKENGGLHIREGNFIPEFISRLLLQKASPIKFWGYIINDNLKNKLKGSNTFKDFLIGNQIKSDITMYFVGTLDNDQSPRFIILKLIWNDEITRSSRECILGKIPANIQR